MQRRSREQGIVYNSMAHNRGGLGMPGSQTAAHWHSIMSRPRSNAACGGMGPHPGLLRSLHARHAALSSNLTLNLNLIKRRMRRHGAAPRAVAQPACTASALRLGFIGVREPLYVNLISLFLWWSHLCGRTMHQLNAASLNLSACGAQPTKTAPCYACMQL